MLIISLKRILLYPVNNFVQSIILGTGVLQKYQPTTITQSETKLQFKVATYEVVALRQVMLSLMGTTPGP